MRTGVGSAHRHKTKSGGWYDRTDVASGATHTHEIPTRGFDVRDYGAIGDGSHDDTAAFQAAVTAAVAAHGTLIIPAAPVWWWLGDTIHIAPSTIPSMAVMHIEASVGPGGINWVGAGDKPMFRAVGWRHSTIRGVNLRTALSDDVKDNVIAWDLTTSPAAGSSTNLTFIDCKVNMDGLGTGTVGWRLGHDRDGDISANTWIACSVNGKAELGAAEHGIGWALECQNALQNQWFGCFALNLAKKMTNVPTAGAFSLTGGGSIYVYGDGGAYNAIEFEYQRKGDPLLIAGGRWEHGHTFLSVDNSADPTLSQNVTVQNANISAFTADTLFQFQSAGTLVLDNLSVGTDSRRPPYGDGLVRLGAIGTKYGSLFVRGGSYDAGPTLHTEVAGSWAVDVLGALRQDAANNVLGAIPRVSA